MERLTFEYPAQTRLKQRAHVGVVASGDLEILMVPSGDGSSHVAIQTSVPGFGSAWKAVLDRFFERYEEAVQVDIHDCGATPGMVALRLQQAAEVSRS
jgi:malonate decarboxylase delta subunit